MPRYKFFILKLTILTSIIKQKFGILAKNYYSFIYIIWAVFPSEKMVLAFINKIQLYSNLSILFVQCFYGCRCRYLFTLEVSHRLNC